MAVAPWLLWVFVRLTGLEWGFPIVPLMAYTPYMAVGALVPVAVGLALRRWAPALIAAIAGLVLVALVAPRAVSDPFEGTFAGYGGRIEVRVVSSNIYRGRADLDQLIEIVRSTDADILSVQELTAGAARRLERLGIDRLFRHRELVFAGETSGGGIYSRFRLRPSPPIEIPPRIKATGELLAMPRALASVPGAGRVDVVAAHPFPPTPGRVGSWEKGLDSFPSAGDGPLRLLLGDFNATLDHDAFRDLLAQGYRDAAEVTGDGLKPTWRAGSLIPPPVTIDHVVADRRIGIAGYEVHDLPGSDHETLSATLVLPPQGGYVD